MTSIDRTGDLFAPQGGVNGRFRRFAKPFRAAIEGLAEGSPRLAELGETFPALLFALATGFATEERRRASLSSIHGGAALRDAAAALGLPWWLRRLPPEAFVAPLGHGMPDGAAFACRVGSLLPSDAADARAWLARLLFAYRTVGEDYAVWIARQKRFPGGGVGDISETLLAAWAWHANRPETPLHGLLRTPWSEAISLRRALDEAKAWSMRIDLAVALGHGIDDPWFPAGEHGAYEFVPLQRLEQFLAEALVMNNCLDQFADHVRQGRSRVFSVRKSGRAVADLEIGAHDDDCCIPRIVQLRGPRNRRVGTEVWQATLAWLAAQDFRPLPRINDTAERMRRQQLIRVVWRPMLDSLKGTPTVNRVQAVAFGKEVSNSFRVFQAAVGATRSARAHEAEHTELVASGQSGGRSTTDG